MAITAPVITVFGATGNQGSAVVKSLLKNPSFQVRALTRNPNSDASRALESQGAEIQHADGFDYESLLTAFRGSWGAFVNVNSDEKVSNNITYDLLLSVLVSFTNTSLQAFKPEGPTEFDMSKKVVDAAAEAGVKHLIYSTGPDCIRITGGKLTMKAMDSK